jgi:selenocysteine lyase/cysteine desulfurase
MLTRRGFLVTSSLALAASTISINSKVSSDWSAVRGEFELDPELVHLSLFYMTPHPRPVRTAVESYRRQLDANPFLTVEHSLFDFANFEKTMPVVVAGAVASYIGAASGEDIALTQNTSTGLSLVYHGLPLKAGDEILTTTHDHYVHHESIRYAAERSGATWRKIALYDDRTTISAGDIVARIRKGIGAKTRVLGVTWVHSSSGVKLPIRRIAEAVAELNANRDAKSRILLVVDGVHGLGVEDPAVVTSGADVFVAGTHKWLFAPRGTGFVWAKPQVWATMRPLIPTFHSGELWDAWANEKKTVEGTPVGRWFTPGGFQAFEHWWAVPAAIEMHRRIGIPRITDRIHTLNEQLKTELAKMPHVTLHTPLARDLSSGIICFEVQGKTPAQVVETLHHRDKILASTTPYRTPYARVAFGIYNTEAEVEKTVKAIRALA